MIKFLKNVKNLYKLKFFSKKKNIKKYFNIFYFFLKKKIILYKRHKKSFLITGTGGDKKNTFNISSVTSIVISFFNLNIFKYGSKSYTSLVGSMDFFNLIKLNFKRLNLLPATMVFKNIENISKLRLNYKKKSLFNFVFPVLNPIKYSFHIIGSCENFFHELEFLKKLKRKFLIISSIDGMDEVSIFNNTKVSVVFNKKINSFLLKIYSIIKIKIFKKINIKSCEDSIEIFFNLLKNKNRTARNEIFSNLYVILKSFLKTKNHFFFLKTFFKEKKFLSIINYEILK
ncbi:hypothetical protein [Candidatus Vidania fulgoroideorum]